MRDLSTKKDYYKIALLLAFFAVLIFNFSDHQARAQLIDPPADPANIDLEDILDLDPLGDDITNGDINPPLLPGEETNTGAQDDTITNRQEKDKEETKKEAEELQRLQEEEDIKVCKEKEKTVNSEVGQSNRGKPGGGGGPRQDDAYGDDDGDGIPNYQDPDQGGDPNNTPANIPPACQDSNTAGYIAANEGVNNEAYSDSRGFRTIGVGHRI
ncbi:MAG TPA: hypothetical protein P5274_00405, partial [Candidatus Paceibacterota bacterium]|nr:hypothetical protein [Candidatus Paceibacterota bacterium]